jgi:hypothetical protein
VGLRGRRIVVHGMRLLGDLKELIFEFFDPQFQHVSFAFMRVPLLREFLSVTVPFLCEFLSVTVPFLREFLMTLEYLFLLAGRQMSDKIRFIADRLVTKRTDKSITHFLQDKCPGFKVVSGMQKSA